MFRKNSLCWPFFTMWSLCFSQEWLLVILSPSIVTQSTLSSSLTSFTKILGTLGGTLLNYISISLVFFIDVCIILIGPLRLNKQCQWTDNLYCCCVIVHIRKHINVSTYTWINLHSSCINHEGNEGWTKTHKYSEYMPSHVSATFTCLWKNTHLPANYSISGLKSFSKINQWCDFKSKYISFVSEVSFYNSYLEFWAFSQCLKWGMVKLTMGK